MKLIPIKNNMGYIENSCNLGYIAADKDIVLIDSGLEDSVAKKIVKLLDREGYRVKAVINTHSHADHCGGNNYLQNKIGALIFAPEFEAAIIENPYLEPIYLSAGASPVKDLTNKFLMAKPSRVDHIIEKSTKNLQVDSLDLEVVALPGHAVHQIGIAMDGVLYCGDSILNKELLEKHKIPFNVNITDHIKTLEFLRDSHYETYIPSHCQSMNRSELIKAVDENLATLEDINNVILKTVETPKTLEEIEQSVFDNYNIEIKNLTQYSLLKTSVIAHINYLLEQKAISQTIENNKVCWRR